MIATKSRVESSAVRLRVGVLLAGLAALGACTRHVPPPESLRQGNGTTVTLERDSMSFVRVEAALAAPAVSQRTYVARVAFDERRVARIGAPVVGRVTAVNVIEGDTVTAGQVLVSIHSQDIAAALAHVAQSRAAMLLAGQQVERFNRLAEQGAGSQAELQTAQTAFATARLEQNRAQAALAALGGGRGTGSEDYGLRTPMAGIVVERHVAVGSETHTDQDTPLLVVADLSRVWVLADVYESDLATLEEGSAAEVEITALPDRAPLAGRVTSVARVLDRSTRTATARIELANPSEFLRPGMSARVRIAQHGRGSADVPMSAILARRDQFFVYVSTGERSFRRQLVRLVEQHGDRVVLDEGVRAGDMVAAQGAILLDSEANAL